MKILVTGGNGFIATNFISLALENGHQIVSIDNLCFTDLINHEYSSLNHNNFTFLKADIRDTDIINLIETHSFDCVLNFAAESHVDKSIHSDKEFISTNILGTHNLLSSCHDLLKKNILPKHFKFIQVSTDEVYGSLPMLESPFSEQSKLHPSNPYSASKASADLICLSYYKTYKFPVIITRCSNNYGPYQYPEKLIPLLLSKLDKDEPLPIYGDGMQIRDWIYVLDHCSGILKAILKGCIGEIYNFGSSSELTNIECVRKIIRVVKSDDNHEKYITNITDRLGHDRRYAINASKAINHLDWTPDNDFDTGLKMTIEWYQKNKKWTQAQVESKNYISWVEKKY